MAVRPCTAIPFPGSSTQSSFSGSELEQWPTVAHGRPPWRPRPSPFFSPARYPLRSSSRVFVCPRHAVSRVPLLPPASRQQAPAMAGSTPSMDAQKFQQRAPFLAVRRGARRLFDKMCSKPRAAAALPFDLHSPRRVSSLSCSLRSPIRDAVETRASGRRRASRLGRSTKCRAMWTAHTPSHDSFRLIDL
uniref:Uncharacterized protein n=1 Tax=Zea mays TaxID=4577 RepID=A0A804QJ43_MAIZE